MNERVAIIGGEGNMGRLTTTLFQNIGQETIVSDVANPNTLTPVEAIRTSRIVFFSVLPVSEIPVILEAARDVITPEHVILDNASSKTPLMSVLNNLADNGLSVCSTHPMCKHDQPLHGQKVILMDVGQNSQKARQLAEKLYTQAGMIVVELPFESHDHSMLIVQGLPHLLWRAVGEVYAKYGIDPEALQKLGTANFRLFDLAMWRTLVQKPEISTEIIGNFAAQEEGRQLVADLQEAITVIIGSNERAVLSESLRRDSQQLDRNGIKSRMNEISTTVLERLANLDVESLKVISPVNKTGVLEKLAGAFARAGISLTAIDSHVPNGSVEFRIGIDEKTSSPQSLIKAMRILQRRGFTVAEKA